MPSLSLSWAAREGTSGVPATVRIAALDELGRPEARGGSVLLWVADARARLTQGSGRTALAGAPTTRGQRVRVPLTGGRAEVEIAYTTLGDQRVLGQVEGSVEVAGESDTLAVREAVVAVVGAPSAQAGSAARFTVSAPRGYSGTLVVRTSDGEALVARPGASGERGGEALASVAATGAGEVAIVFGTAGAQTVRVTDADNPAQRASLSVSVTGAPAAAPAPSPSPSASPSPSPSASPGRTPAPSATPAATAGPTPVPTKTPTPTGSGMPAATGTPVPVPTKTPEANPSPSPSPTRGGEPRSAVPAEGAAAAGVAGGAIEGRLASLALQGTASFSVMMSSTTTNAGVQLTLTATALTSGGQVDTAYRGQIKMTSTDAAFAPGTAYRYTYTAADNGVHAFTVTFNTAGSAQTITIIDTANAAMTGTSPSVNVGETYLQATFGAGTVVQG